MQIEEKAKAVQSEIKIHREPRVKGRKPGLKSMIWNKRKEEINIQLEQNEETRILKNEERLALGTFRTT